MKMKALLLGSLSTILVACGGGAGSTTTVDACADLSSQSESFDCGTALQGINTSVVNTITSFEASLTTLSTEVDAYCADTSDDTDVRSAFKGTMAIAQQLEVMQFGAYKDVRDDFYIWPNNSLCRIDDQIATAPDASISTIDKGKRGLTAVEYLIFSEDVAAQCQNAFSVPAWMSDTPDLVDRKTARCNYAKRIVDDLEVKVATLNADQSAYDFETAFDSLQQGANSISDALFYVDTETKDSKVKAALPQASNESFDASKLESQFANISIDNIANNLLGAKTIILAGLDDYLTAKGQDDLTADMVTAIDGALANIAEIDGTLDAAILAGGVTADQCINLGTNGTYSASSSDLEAFCALQWNIKTFTDLLKQDFVLALNFTTPATADGDND